MLDALPSTLVPALLIAVAIALGTVTILLGWETLRTWWRRRSVLRRLEPMLEEVQGSNSLLRSESGSESPLDRALEGIGVLSGIRHLIEGAGLKWSPGAFLLGSAGLALSVGMFIFVLIDSLLIAAVMSILSGTLPYAWLRRQATRKLLRFEEQFPEAIDLMGRAIRAGHPLSAGIRMVADEGPPEVAAQFRTIFEAQRFGLPIDDALLSLADQIDLVDVRIFTTAVLVQREVGGNLAEILDKISQTIRSRFSIRRQLRVYTAQGRISGYILAALPLVVAAILFMINREYMMVLVEHPLGRGAVATAMVAQVIGYLWIRRIVDIDI